MDYNSYFMDKFVPDLLHDLFGPFLTVFERFYERFRSFMTFLGLELLTLA
jgi:hypothetical protein